MVLGFYDLSFHQINEVYNETKIEKGSAFPTCISVNNCVGHFSPSLEDKTILREGDVVKVDLGAHIDGYITQVAFTWPITSKKDQPIIGRAADVICASHLAAEAALHLLKAGNTVGLSFFFLKQNHSILSYDIYRIQILLK
jgi:methionine aminopeptidase